MARRVPLVLTTLVSLCAPAVAAAAPSDPDAGFGRPDTPGIVQRDGSGKVTDLLVQADGKILEAGDGLSSQNDLAIQRRLSNGAIDCTFGTRNSGDGRGGHPVNGTTAPNGQPFDTAFRTASIVKRPDGDLIVVGMANAMGSEYVVFGRYSAGGILKSTVAFPGPGYAYGALLTSATLTPDGGVSVASHTLSYSYFYQDAHVYKTTAANGKDTGFGTDGVAKIPAYYASSVTGVDGPGANDVIVASGNDRLPQNSSSGFPTLRPRLVALKESDGSPAPYFNGASDYVFPNVDDSTALSFQMERGIALGAKDAQKLSVGGVFQKYGQFDSGFGPPQAAFARFNADGTADTGFGTRGSGQMILPDPLGAEGPPFTVALRAAAGGGLRSAYRGGPIAGVTATGQPETAVGPNGTTSVSGLRVENFAITPDKRWVFADGGPHLAGNYTARFLGEYTGPPPAANTEDPNQLCTEPVSYTIDDGVVPESGGSNDPQAAAPGKLNVRIDRSDTNGPRYVDVTVKDIGTTAGEDYVLPETRTAYFAPGATRGYFTFGLTDDDDQEPAEQLEVTTKDTFPGSVNTTGTMTVSDNDTPQTYSIADEEAVEGDGGPAGSAMTFTVTRTVTDTAGHVQIKLESGSATFGTDFGGDSDVLEAHFAAGAATATIEVPINGDEEDEEDEGFLVSTLGSGTTPEAQAGGTIRDDDVAPAGAPPRLSIGNTSAIEGGPGTGGQLQFPLTLNAAASEDVSATVELGGSATPGSDYQAPAATVTIPAGETQGTISVPVIGDDAGEPEETVTVTLRDPIEAELGNATAVGTILNDDKAGSPTTPFVPQPAPTPSPTPTPPTTPPDTVGPAVVIPSANKTLTATSTGAVPFAFGPAPEDTSGVISLKTDGKVKAARAAARKKVLALGSKSFQVLKGQKIVVKVKLSKAGKKTLKKLKKVKVQATITLRDARGNATIKAYRFTLKASKKKRR